ncbi:leucyl aminopeptidase [uncultured Clostridium sp.]|uniref:leucyl aminopeptidase n=1 Tax=uncultured Clostridium sp. TaxID=59620 RepID=UPI00263736B0|nr:leucyl aminopeptidase [uncultured Clostridium sp.]
MKINVRAKKCREAQGLILSLFEDRLEVKNPTINKMVSHLKDNEKFLGKAGEVYTFTREIEGSIQDVILLGLGKESDLDSEKIKVNMAKAYKKAQELKISDLVVKMFATEEIKVSEVAKAVTIALLLTDYKFDKYKSDRKEEKEVEVSFSGCVIKTEGDEVVSAAVEEAIDMAEGIIIARDLVNEPANIMYPKVLAKEVSKLGKEFGFQVEVFEKDKIEELGMEAFLAVAKGSKKKPRLIVMRYFGDEANREKTIGLVGKGLTFDTGGYSLKPSNSMDTMKSDMGGAAAVVGTMALIAKRKLKVNVVSVIASCENAISGDAYKPGDIIGSMKGTTIEVLNTDAEGRLTLVDAVTYIQEKENVKEVIDLATLTGAALVALGDTTTAILSNDDKFFNEIENASLKAGEKLWRLPAFDEYRDLIKSDIADLKNIGGRYAGTITAGLFIEKFINEGNTWIHMDIAGTAWTDSPKPYKAKGGTGIPVNTLYEMLKERSSK